jgi:hypothetical protein
MDLATVHSIDPHRNPKNGKGHPTMGFIVSKEATGLLHLIRIVPAYFSTNP